MGPSLIVESPSILAKKNFLSGHWGAGPPCLRQWRYRGVCCKRNKPNRRSRPGGGLGQIAIPVARKFSLTYRLGINDVALRQRARS